MERLKKYIIIVVSVLLLGYIYNYLMEIGALFSGNRKILSKMRLIESKIDKLINKKSNPEN